MIVDVHAHFGKWPHWPIPVTQASQLVETLDGMNVDRAVVASTRSLFVNWEDGNRETERALGEHPERLIGFACLGPLELSHTLGPPDYDFDRIAEAGFRGIRLYPQYHSYPLLYEPFVDRICEEARARGWPVQLSLRVIMNWGMPMLSLDWIAGILERHPKTAWILTGINYLHELRVAVAMMRRFDDVYLETSCVQGYEAIRKLVDEVGFEQLLHGSGAPLQNGAAALAKVLRAHITDTAREAILGGNACRLLELTD